MPAFSWKKKSRRIYKTAINIHKKFNMFAIEDRNILISIVLGTKSEGRSIPTELPILDDIIPTIVEYILSFFGNQFAESLLSFIYTSGKNIAIKVYPTIT